MHARNAVDDPNDRLSCRDLATATILLVAVFMALPLGVVRAQTVNEPPPADASAEKGPPLQRRLQVAQGAGLPAVVVTEFFTNGELDAGGKSLAVRDARRNPVPWRVLQVGPGDFCRIAFQTTPRQHAYQIHFGGKGEPEASPNWTSEAGLILETRKWKNCDLNKESSVRAAWNEAEPLAAGYVPNVYHRENPFWPDPDMFLSRYHGKIHASRGGNYRFYTSSQDCSFLSIDGKLVVSSPGWHGPTGDARFKGEVNLSPGSHEFEYLHAVAGPETCMVAAWEPPGSSKPETIPAQAFNSEDVAVLPSVTARRPRDLAVEIAGEVPVIDSEVPMIRAQFRAIAARSSTGRPKLHWDFGDGQTSNVPDPVHIYLRPGLYTVTLRGAGEPEGQAVVNRVPIHRALVFADESHPADPIGAYLTILDKYDAAKLDARSLLQLVRAFSQVGQLPRAAKAAQAGILADRPPLEGGAGIEVVRVASEILRDKLDDPSAALKLREGAVRMVDTEPRKAECEIEAADIALNDLLQADAAKPLLDSAAKRLEGNAEEGVLIRRLNRVLGDWQARKGDRVAAVAAYARATSAVESRKSTVEQDARRGALNRSTEEFLRAKTFDRALSELRRWQEEYPGDMVDGSLAYLMARYEAARGKWARAITLAGDLVAINPDSPSADRLMFLAAQCEEKRGRPERALAGLQSFLTDYPGSPLVGEARKEIERLGKKTPGKP